VEAPAPCRRRPGSANEERRGADQDTVVDLPHEEVRDIRTADRAESAVATRYRGIEAHNSEPDVDEGPRRRGASAGLLLGTGCQAILNECESLSGRLPSLSKEEERI
jgi:hypothetical protein